MGETMTVQQAERALSDARKAYDARLRDIEARAGKLRDWRAELGRVESEAANLEAARIAALDADDSKQADKLQAQLDRLGRHAADLRGMIGRRESEIAGALGEAHDGEYRTMKLAEHKADGARLVAARAEYARLRDAAAVALGALNVADFRHGGSAWNSSDTLNVKLRAEWIGKESARILGAAEQAPVVDELPVMA